MGRHGDVANFSRPRVPASPRPRVTASPRHRVPASPCPRVPASPRPRLPLAPLAHVHAFQRLALHQSEQIKIPGD
jgi:hypothetical protein